MKLFILVVLLSLYASVQSMSRDDDNSAPSLRTFLLYYLLQQQTSSSTSTASQPVNANINITDSINTTDITLTVRGRQLDLKHIDVPDPDGRTFQRYMVPIKYFGMVKDLVAEYQAEQEHDRIDDENEVYEEQEEQQSTVPN